jgi:hypothetical protein
MAEIRLPYLVADRLAQIVGFSGRYGRFGREDVWAE